MRKEICHSTNYLVDCHSIVPVVLWFVLPNPSKLPSKLLLGICPSMEVSRTPNHIHGESSRNPLKCLSPLHWMLLKATAHLKSAMCVNISATLLHSLVSQRKNTFLVVLANMPKYDLKWLQHKCFLGLMVNQSKQWSELKITFPCPSPFQSERLHLSVAMVTYADLKNIWTMTQGMSTCSVLSTLLRQQKCCQSTQQGG